MVIVITGANGFIGKNLTKIFTSLGHSVIPIAHEDLEWTTILKEVFKDITPDYIIHLAAYGNHANQPDTPRQFLYSNIIGTFNLLEATVDVPYKGFINIGSSSEYGKKDSTMRESDVPETDTFYGASKVATVYLSRAFAKKYNKPIVTVRPFSVYGPGEAEFRFIPTIIKNLLNNTEMKVDPSGYHDWIYIDDFISGLVAVMANAEELKGEIVNIGTGKQYSNGDVVATLEMISGRNLKHSEVNGMRTQDSHVWRANTNKLKLLGWRPETSLLDGLIKTYQRYKDAYDKQQ